MNIVGADGNPQNGVMTTINLLNPYGLIGGLTTVAVFLLHGANFLSLKLDGDLHEQARAFSKKSMCSRQSWWYCWASPPTFTLIF